MKSPPYLSEQHRQQRSGFALIASLSIMAFLVLIAVALYSLSSVATKSAANAAARTEAQANAKMALMAAIGELQQSMGPDQRISANAAIFDTDRVTSTIEGVNHPKWVGVWDSWIAGDINDASVDPAVYPSNPSQHQTIGDPMDVALQAGMKPDYDEKEGHFREWLVSLDPDEQGNFASAGILNLNADQSPESASTAVRLVGDGSLGPSADNQDYVSAGLLEVDGNESSTSGRYAWWIGDESQKATILPDSYSSAGSLSDAERIYRSQAPDQMGNDLIPEFGSISDETQLDKISTFRSLDMVDVDPEPGANDATLSELNFHNTTLYNFGVLADVREGGLKRDLNTLLERPINLEDDGDEFMLYNFNREGETVLDERVPIQDLAAFYQLYRDSNDFSNGGRGGIEYTSDQLNESIQTDVPNYSASEEEYLREYTALYRNPVPVKVQFVLGVGASRITDGSIDPSDNEREYANNILASKGLALRDSDQYKLSLGVKPVVSLWNPNNVPLVMNTDASQEMRVGFPPFVIQWKKYRASGDEFTSNYVNLNYAITNESTGDGRARYLDPYIIKIQYAKNDPIIFEPGEIKTFTVDIPTENWLESDGDATFGDNSLYEAKEFSPDGFYVTAKVASPSGIDVVKIEGSSYQGYRLVFGEEDKITFAVYPESDESWSRAVARANEVAGGGLQFFMRGKNADNRFRNYQFISRFGQDGNSFSQQTTTEFNAELMLAGFPGGEVIPFESETNAMPGASGESNIKSFTDAGAAKGLLMFTLQPGCELNNQYTGGFSAGRRITTRPFLHGSILSAPQIADNSPAGLYDYGWEWQVEKINDTEEVLQDDGNSRGYYGGSYNFGYGTTHVVQQYLPVLPPVSIASLSSAHLGGYSLANNPPVNGDIRNAPELGDFRKTTATGQGGLAPRTLQAIGNAYAHPNILPNLAFTTYTRELNTDVPETDQAITYVDHSYLVNKALWDDFFFSSITPQFTDVQLQESSDKTAFEVAEDFLFNGQPLPNRRIVANRENLDSVQFATLESQYDDFSDGFADKIAAYLLVNGPFNINSTSVEAWTVLLASLRDKSVAFLDEATGTPASTTSSNETPVGPGMLPNDEPISSGSITSDPALPLNQWKSWRSLSDTEIEELASAIVKQVKERGPFLSLSEFINRRLDSTNRDLAVKGTLQAALDDDSVSINAAFRDDTGTTVRTLDSEADRLEAEGFVPQFPEALDGPVAYGSTPYIDQADILRHLGSTLTPRGDTFVIRSYGDKLDAGGEVIARAWCEAIVQRTPNYLDLSQDENHFTQERLDSETNKNFGRKFSIISFRWLNEDEV